MSSISSRTRSKKVSPLMSLPFSGSSSETVKSKRGRKARSGSGSFDERRKRRMRMEKRAGEENMSSEDERVSISSSEGEYESARGEKGSSAYGASSSRRCLKGKSSETDLVFVGESADKRGLVFVSGCKRRRESPVEAETREVIEIDESDDDDDDDDDNGIEEKRFQGVVDVEEEDNIEEGKGSDMFGNKDKIFVNDGCDHGPANPVTIDSDGDRDSVEECGMIESNSAKGNIESHDDGDDDDNGAEEILKHSEKSEEGTGSNVFAEKGENFGNDNFGMGPSNVIEISETEEEEHGDSQTGEEYDVTESDSFTYGFLCSSTDSEDNETSDEDYHVDEEDGSSSSEDSSDSSDDDNKERRRYSRVVEKWKRKVKDERDGVYRKNGLRKYQLVEEGEHENTPSLVNSGEDYDSDTSSELQMNGGSPKDKNEIGDLTKVKKRKRNNASANNADRVNLDSRKGKEHHDKGKRVRSDSSLLENKEKIGDSTKARIMEKKRREHKYGNTKSDREKKARVDKETGHRDGKLKVPRKPSRRKEEHLIELLYECFQDKHDSVEGDSNGLQEKDDDVNEQDTQPPDCEETPTLKLVYELSKEEMVKLWKELEMALREEEMYFLVGNIGTNETKQNTGSSTPNCKHDFTLNEEIGIYCKLCGWVATEIRHVDPPFATGHFGRSRKRESSDEANISPFDGDQFNVSNGDSQAPCSNNEGTVWDLIPDIKQSLYPHQQEGFEFIWTNLTGTIDLDKLKSADPCSSGGCIISHAPGTGKTRLTMVFLQTYLQVFPRCLPVIVAPASILLTWEDEFKKWDIGVPFHNLNNPELSGKEHVNATNRVDLSRNRSQNKDAVRMVKLYSWSKERSILGISYHLYEKLAGGISKADVKTKKKKGNMKEEKQHVTGKENTKSDMIGKVLLDHPGLLILDEGHTPRNQRSNIWNVLKGIQTQKRIILSGTPFQNNFLELYNTICIVKPSFSEKLPRDLKKFCQSRLMHEKKKASPQDMTWEPVGSGNNNTTTTGNSADEMINQLKLLMDPFVHVHKGSILQKNLPGKKDCVLTLKPENIQKKILECIECSQNTLNFEHKVALVSVHPSLFLTCPLSEKEELVIKEEKLEERRLDPYAGVKTRFLVEFVRMCDAFNEKVLVFSQFIDPLSLIKEQLKSVFNWYEGKEVLCMYGKLEQKEKQIRIHSFNDANSQAKIVLASTKACSEGINLVGASRVVLLDVVWNPSVERQAISRAYRLGQKRVVYTYHLLTEGTPECIKHCKQAEKDRISELVFSSRNVEDDRPMSCAENFEDRVLDGMVRHDKLKDMFAECVVQQKEKDLF